MHPLSVPRLDGQIRADDADDLAEQHPPVREPDQIRLPVQPRVIRRRPGIRDMLLAFADRASLPAGAFANTARHLARAAADLARPRVHRLAILQRDDMTDVTLVIRRVRTVALTKLLPQVSWWMAGHGHVNPDSARKLQAWSRTIQHAILATGREAFDRSRPGAGETNFFVLFRPFRLAGRCGDTRRLYR